MKTGPRSRKVKQLTRKKSRFCQKLQNSDCSNEPRKVQRQKNSEKGGTWLHGEEPGGCLLGSKTLMSIGDSLPRTFNVDVEKILSKKFKKVFLTFAHLQPLHLVRGDVVAVQRVCVPVRPEERGGRHGDGKRLGQGLLVACYIDCLTLLTIPVNTGDVAQFCFQPE